MDRDLQLTKSSIAGDRKSIAARVVHLLDLGTASSVSVEVTGQRHHKGPLTISMSDSPAVSSQHRPRDRTQSLSDADESLRSTSYYD